MHKLQKFPSVWIQYVLKKIYKLTHGSAYRHNTHIWPYISLKRQQDGRICELLVLGKRAPLVAIKDAFNNKESAFHVILSGPSINFIDYRQLSGIKVMGVNGSIALQDRFDIDFPYYMIIDRDFIHDRPDLVGRIVGASRLVFLSPDVLRYIYQTIPVDHIRCQFSIVENISEPGFGGSPNAELLSQWQAQGHDIHVFEQDIPLGFSFDAGLGWFDADTVAYAALQTLVWAGARKVYFHGLDISGASNGKRFYENQGCPEVESRLEKNFKKFIEPSFAGAIPLLQQRGVEVYNLSAQSALNRDIMPFKDWRELVCMESGTSLPG